MTIFIQKNEKMSTIGFFTAVCQHVPPPPLFGEKEKFYQNSWFGLKLISLQNDFSIRQNDLPTIFKMIYRLSKPIYRHSPITYKTFYRKFPKATLPTLRSPFFNTQVERINEQNLRAPFGSFILMELPSPSLPLPLSPYSKPFLSSSSPFSSLPSPSSSSLSFPLL